MFPVAALLAAAGLWFYLAAEPGPAPPELTALGSQPEVMRALLTQYHARARSSPRSAEAHGQYGQALHANQFYRHARVAFGIAARLDPDDYRWPYYRALIAEERARHDELLPLFEAALNLNPRYTPAVFKLAELHLRRGDLSRAGEYFQRALELAESDTVARLHAAFGLARTARARGDWQAMLTYVETHADDQRDMRQVCQLREEALRKRGAGNLRRCRGDRCARPRRPTRRPPARRSPTG